MECEHDDEYMCQRLNKFRENLARKGVFGMVIKDYSGKEALEWILEGYICSLTVWPSSEAVYFIMTTDDYHIKECEFSSIEEFEKGYLRILP